MGHSVLFPQQVYVPVRQESTPVLSCSAFLRTCTFAYRLYVPVRKCVEAVRSSTFDMIPLYFPVPFPQKQPKGTGKYFGGVPFLRLINQ
jgi:hypothetical protein